MKIKVKVSKCTAFARPKGWKKFGMRENKRAWEENNGEDGMIVDEAEEKKVYAQLAMRTEHFVEEDQDEEDEGKPRDPDAMDEDLENEEGETNENPPREIIKKESLTRGYKYGSSFVPCPTFLPLPQPSTKRGFDFCGVFSIKNFRWDMCMGEVQYIWGDPDSPTHQVALSSIVQAMYEKGVVGVVRYVAREGSDPRMGVIMPTVFDEVDCFLFVQVGVLLDIPF